MRTGVHAPRRSHTSKASSVTAGPWPASAHTSVNCVPFSGQGLPLPCEVRTPGSLQKSPMQEPVFTLQGTPVSQPHNFLPTLPFPQPPRAYCLGSAWRPLQAPGLVALALRCWFPSSPEPFLGLDRAATPQEGQVPSCSPGAPLQLLTHSCAPRCCALHPGSRWAFGQTPPGNLRCINSQNTKVICL